MSFVRDTLLDARPLTYYEKIVAPMKKSAKVTLVFNMGAHHIRVNMHNQTKPFSKLTLERSQWYEKHEPKAIFQGANY